MLIAFTKKFARMLGAYETRIAYIATAMILFGFIIILRSIVKLLFLPITMAGCLTFALGAVIMVPALFAFYSIWKNNLEKLHRTIPALISSLAVINIYVFPLILNPTSIIPAMLYALVVIPVTTAISICAHTYSSYKQQKIARAVALAEFSARREQQIQAESSLFCDDSQPEQK